MGQHEFLLLLASVAHLDLKASPGAGNVVSLDLVEQPWRARGELDGFGGGVEPLLCARDLKAVLEVGGGCCNYGPRIKRNRGNFSLPFLPSSVCWIL